jgi:hypothetical protein
MRKKGTPKTGGRTKGTPNKVTGTLKEFVANLIDQNREQMERDLKSLSPRDRLYALDKLMQYILPKNSSQSLDVKENSFDKLMGSLPDDPYELER